MKGIIYMDSIIFDVDGTLWDSADSVAAAWNLAIKKFSSLDITPVSYTHLDVYKRQIPVFVEPTFTELQILSVCASA